MSYFCILTSDFSLVLHRLYHLKQLLVVGDFDERSRRIRADDIDRRSVLDSYFVSQSFIGVHLSGKLPLRIDNERNIHFALCRELLNETLQIVRSNFRLVLENVVAKLIAKVLALRIKVACPDRRLK